MGLSPAQVNDMSMWEFAACAEAWRDAHTPESDRGMTRAQYDEAAALLKRIEG